MWIVIPSPSHLLLFFSHSLARDVEGTAERCVMTIYLFLLSIITPPTIFFPIIVHLKAGKCAVSHLLSVDKCWRGGGGCCLECGGDGWEMLYSPLMHRTGELLDVWCAPCFIFLILSPPTRHVSISYLFFCPSHSISLWWMWLKRSGFCGKQRKERNCMICWLTGTCSQPIHSVMSVMCLCCTAECFHSFNLGLL